MCDKHLLLKHAQVQEVEDAEREHDGEVFLLPGERGHSRDTGWDDLEEEMVEEQDGNLEQYTEDGSGRGSGVEEVHREARHVTPRGKGRGSEAVMEGAVEADLNAALSDGDESDSGDECAFGLNRM